MKMELFKIGYEAARVDKYWESYGFQMHYDREKSLCLQRVREGKHTEYHLGYLAY